MARAILVSLAPIDRDPDGLFPGLLSAATDGVFRGVRELTSFPPAEGDIEVLEGISDGMRYQGLLSVNLVVHTESNRTPKRSVAGSVKLTKEVSSSWFNINV